MRKHVITLSILVGCNEDQRHFEGIISPDTTAPDVTLPELPDITRPKHYSVIIKSDIQKITGAVSCNAINLDA